MTIRSSILQKTIYAILKISGWKKNVLYDNLDYIYPEMNVSEKKNFYGKLIKNLSQDSADFLTRSWIYRKNDSRFSIDEKSVPVLKKMKRGGLMLTAHFENYEALGHWLVRLGIPLAASYAKLKPEILDKWIHSKFRSIDNYDYSLFINNPRNILRLLDNSKLFCLIADQDFRKSHFILGKFLGQNVHCNPIPAFILKNRPKTPIYICWLESNFQTKKLFAKEIQASDGEEIFSKYHQWLEEKIHLSPEKWYGWIHRRFLSTKEKCFT